MGNGRKAIAPCGHVGEVVIGTFVQCPLCDKVAIPEPVEEKSERVTARLCRHCGSDNIEPWPDLMVSASGDMIYYCHRCNSTFT